MSDPSDPANPFRKAIEELKQQREEMVAKIADGEARAHAARVRVAGLMMLATFSITVSVLAMFGIPASILAASICVFYFCVRVLT